MERKHYKKEDIDFIKEQGLILLKERYFFGLLSKKTPLTGIVSEKYKNGQLKKEMTFWEGIGMIMKLYYKNGQPKEEIIFDEKTIRYGNGKKWYENGQLESEGKLIGYNKTDEWKYWYENGQISRIETWIKNHDHIIDEGKFIPDPYILDSIKCWDKNNDEIDCSNLKVIKSSTHITL